MPALAKFVAIVRLERAWCLTDGEGKANKGVPPLVRGESLANL